MAFCERCGAKLNEGDRFCERCGAPVSISIPQPPPLYFDNDLTQKDTARSSEPEQKQAQNSAPQQEARFNGAAPSGAEQGDSYNYRQNAYDNRQNQRNDYSYRQPGQGRAFDNGQPDQGRAFSNGQQHFQEGMYNAQQKMYEAQQQMQQNPYYIGITGIYGKAFSVLARKPLRLWGISLLNGVISIVLTLLFGLTFGIAVCINILLDVGMTMVYLHGYRGEQVRSVQLFDAFKDGATIKRVLGGMAWRTLWIFIWALIPIVGPIIAIVRAYQYTLTPYILVTEPDVPATEAINVSKQRTEGWKLKMFLADILISIFIFLIGLIPALFARIPYLGMLFSFIIFIVMLLVGLFLPLFMGLVHAAFYEEINASLK